jgi:predicted regulator of Ras-like GTPase activity (Roadblock/LC7/MglB family)
MAASDRLPEDRATQLAAVSSGLASLSASAAELFARGTVMQSVIEMHGGYLLLMRVGDGSQLAVLAAADCEIRQVGYEMAVLVERVGSEIEVPLTSVQVRSNPQVHEHYSNTFVASPAYPLLVRRLTEWREQVRGGNRAAGGTPGNFRRAPPSRATARRAHTPKEWHSYRLLEIIPRRVLRLPPVNSTLTFQPLCWLSHNRDHSGDSHTS